jgi:hypothetical protein
MISGDDASGIPQMRGEREVELFAPIDFLDSHHGAVQHFARHHGVGPGTGKDEAERNGGVIHGELAPERTIRRLPGLPAGCATMPKKTSRRRIDKILVGTIRSSS